MKQLIYLLTVLFAFTACNSSLTEKPAGTDRVTTVPVDTSQAVKYKRDTAGISSKSKYDPAFIKGLEKSGTTIQLIDNYIISNNHVTYFPENLPLNEKTTFKGSKATWILYSKLQEQVLQI